LIGFGHYHFNMEELTPIEIRVRTLVEDFFASKITGNEFKLELARMREEFEPSEKKKRRARGKGRAKVYLSDRRESSHPMNAQL
jgi:hypothetical protein